MSVQHMIAAATAVFDPGSCQVGGRSATGTYRGYPVVLEYRVSRSASSGAGRGMLIVIVHGPTGGVRFHVSAVPLLPDPQYQITGDPTFDSRYDVRGAPGFVPSTWLRFVWSSGISMSMTRRSSRPQRLTPGPGCRDSGSYVRDTGR